jgi:uncharacterized damage-inducible protein DinB
MSGQLFLDATIETFQKQKELAEGAIAQLDFDRLREPLDRNTNSIAVIMKHVAGNLISRWTDFLTTDGENPNRNRDGEFIDDFASREQLLEHWERGWAVLFQTLEELTPIDLPKIVTIRGEPHTVVLAIQRALGHTGYHTGQIVQTARVLAGDNWTVLTMPRKGDLKNGERGA